MVILHEITGYNKLLTGAYNKAVKNAGTIPTSKLRQLHRIANNPRLNQNTNNFIDSLSLAQRRNLTIDRMKNTLAASGIKVKDRQVPITHASLLNQANKAIYRRGVNASLDKNQRKDSSFLTKFRF